LEEYGLVVLTYFPQQVKVLGIAGADLEGIRILVYQLNIARIHYLGYDSQACFLTGVGQHFQTFFAQTGKIVRRTPGLHRATAQNFGTRRLNGTSRLEQGIVLFHTAGATGHYDIIATDNEIAHLDAGAFGAETAA